MSSIGKKELKKYIFRGVAIILAIVATLLISCVLRTWTENLMLLLFLILIIIPTFLRKKESRNVFVMALYDFLLVPLSLTVMLLLPFYLLLVVGVAIWFSVPGQELWSYTNFSRILNIILLLVMCLGFIISSINSYKRLLEFVEESDKENYRERIRVALDITRLTFISITSVLLILVKVDEEIAKTIGKMFTLVPLPIERIHTEGELQRVSDILGLMLPSLRIDSIDTSIQIAISQMGVSLILITWGLRIFIEYKKLK